LKCCKELTGNGNGRDGVTNKNQNLKWEHKTTTTASHWSWYEWACKWESHSPEQTL